MMAVLRETLPPDDERWAYEMKWDGVRAVVYVDGGRARAMSRNDIDMTAAYPELREMAASLGSRPVVLDGEIVALDARGRPSFERLQPRMHVGNATQIRRLAASTPVTFMAFDVLHLDGRPTIGPALHRAARLLESLQLQGRSWQTPPAWFGGGAMVLEAAREQGLEGVVAKRLDSPTTRVGAARTGSRSSTCGPRRWSSAAGSRATAAGRAWSARSCSVCREPRGSSTPARWARASPSRRWRSWARSCAPWTPESPFADDVPRPDAREAHWVEPVVVGEVRFAEWTRDGRLRHPAWRGLRPDKAPQDVVREDRARRLTPPQRVSCGGRSEGVGDQRHRRRRR